MECLSPDEVWLVEFPAIDGANDYHRAAFSFLTVVYLIPPDGEASGYRLSGYLSACGEGRIAKQTHRYVPKSHETLRKGTE